MATTDDPAAVVQCGGKAHHVRVAHGDLVALDHDVVAERVVVASGGEAPSCIELLDAWRHYRPDPRDPREVLALLAPEVLSGDGQHQLLGVHRARGHGPLLDPRHHRRGGGQPSAERLAIERRRSRWFLALYSLPALFRRAHFGPVLLRRLEARAVPGASELAALDLLVYRTARHHVALALRNAGADAVEAAEVAAATRCSIARPGSNPAATPLDAKEPGRLEVPLAWPRTVWVPGNAILGGRFVLELPGPGSTAAAVKTISWSRGPSGRWDPVVAT